MPEPVVLISPALYWVPPHLMQEYCRFSISLLPSQSARYLRLERWRPRLGCSARSRTYRRRNQIVAPVHARSSRDIERNGSANFARLASSMS